MGDAGCAAAVDAAEAVDVEAALGVEQHALGGRGAAAAEVVVGVAEGQVAERVAGDVALAGARVALVAGAGDALERRRELMQAWASYCGNREKVVYLAAAKLAPG